MSEPLLALDQVSRTFTLGDQIVPALQQVSLTIDSGELVAIVGASGSGKSTLMQLLGCLDRPTAGHYRVAGQDLAHLSVDQLATLRCRHFGFIFQRYHLLSHLSVRYNVELAAIYAGLSPQARRQRAEGLLTALGLADRLDYLPEKLSGGQQQRVSIGRALMNGGEIILADEPTGALDSRSGEQIMATLKALHQQGHTVVIVTHDASIAAQMERVITLRDGVIVEDRRHVIATAKRHATGPHRPLTHVPPLTLSRTGPLQRQRSGFHFREALRMAWMAMLTSKQRSLLTLLSIAIGVTAVVSTATIGSAVKESMLKDFREATANKLAIFPGKFWGDPDISHGRALTVGDLQALRQQPFVAAVSPKIVTAQSLRRGRRNFDARINGVNEDYFKIQGIELAAGTVFTADQVACQAPVAVIDHTTQQQLLGPHTSGIGKILLIGNIPVQVVGVILEKGDREKTSALSVWIPYTVASNKLVGQRYFDCLLLRVSDRYNTQQVEQQITQLLSLRHGQKDFLIQNLDNWLQTQEKIFKKLQYFLILVALITLLVGGIGVMNIMLVSVRERIREIGIRMAVGARQRDVQLQFLTEAVLICLAGGIGGSLLSLVVGAAVHHCNPSWPITFAPLLLTSTIFGAMAIGVAFGYLPARRAAQLDPIEALTNG